MSGHTRTATPIHFHHILAVQAVQAYRTTILHQAVVAAGQYARAAAAYNEAVATMAALHATSATLVHSIMVDPEACMFCDREEQDA